MFTPLPFFNPWMLTNPTLPKLYWKVKSPEQLIANLYCIIDAIKDPLNDTIELSNKNAETIEAIEKVIKSIENGQYTEKYIDGLAQYIDDNLQSLVARIAQYVFPTFYWDGDAYRIALVVPQSWAWLKFNFNYDTANACYTLSLEY